MPNRVINVHRDDQNLMLYLDRTIKKSLVQTCLGLINLLHFVFLVRGGGTKTVSAEFSKSKLFKFPQRKHSSVF